MGKERPYSLDGLKPTSTKFERPCAQNSLSTPSSSKPQKASRPTSFEKLVPILLKFDRLCYSKFEKARPLYDYGPTKFTRPTSPKSKLGTQIAKFTLIDLSRQGCPPKYSSGSFKVWGSSFQKHAGNL